MTLAEEGGTRMITDVETLVDTKLVAGLLRGLAIDVETNPILANQVLDALITAGLLEDDAADLAADSTSTASPAAGILSSTTLIGLQVAKIDILTLYRTGGMEQLRGRLTTLDLNSLRRLIQIQQLDPEKKTAKLRSLTKLIDFIVELASSKVEEERELARSASWML